MYIFTSAGMAVRSRSSLCSRVHWHSHVCSTSIVSQVVSFSSAATASSFAATLVCSARDGMGAVLFQMLPRLASMTKGLTIPSLLHSLFSRQLTIVHLGKPLASLSDICRQTFIPKPQMSAALWARVFCYCLGLIKDSWVKVVNGNSVEVRWTKYAGAFLYCLYVQCLRTQETDFAVHYVGILKYQM